MKYTIAPYITEKSYRGISEENKGSQTYVFKVTTTAGKTDIKKMVEAAYQVHVEDVRTLRQTGKARRFRNIPGRTAATKRALVRLRAGERIAAFDTATATPNANE